MPLPPAEIAFIVKIREQVEFLKNEDYSYDELHVYVSGIAEPWPFGRDHEFKFEGDELLVVRAGPPEEQDNEGVPEVVFPIRHIVATELAVSEEEE